MLIERDTPWEIVDQETGSDYHIVKVVVHEGKIRIVISENKD
jgi:hypothetical protein